MAGTLIWFRRDLRLSDHAVVHEAAARGWVLPVFVLDDALLFHPETAVARVAFLLESLRALDRELRERGGRLIVRRGEPAATLIQLVRASGASAVMAFTDSERIVGRVRDGRVNRQLGAAGIPMQWRDPAGSTADLVSYRDWSQRWHQVMAEPVCPAPARLQVPPPSEAVPDLPIPSLAALGLLADGKPIPAAGTAAASERLQAFCQGPASRTYYWELSYPAARVTSGLSPYLKFGAITARQCLQQLSAAMAGADRSRQRSAVQLASRLRWGQAIQQRFRYLPQLELCSLWSPLDSPQQPLHEEWYAAWRQGRTGYPIVDAAARCLAAEGGWLELNFRTRAIYASFLANLCGIDWRYGALHFMRHLIDGDCPIDHYQWAMQAGVTYHGDGAWSRIYHPGQVAVNRCDPQGVFIRRWLPELASLTNDQLGQPPAMADYPRPILDYDTARRERVETLQRQRLTIGALNAAMARLPRDLTPFAAQRIAGAQVQWAEHPLPAAALFPAAIDPDALDPQQWQALLSWFSQGRSPQGASAQSKPSGRRQRRGSREAPGQLHLDLPGL